MKVLEFLQEDNGGFSSTRLAFLLWVIGSLAVWIYMSVHEAKLAALSEGLLTMIGILMTGNGVQKF